MASIPCYCFHALLWTTTPLVPCIQCFHATVCATVPALIVQLTFTFWSNFSALASPPRRRRLAVSFMDRSSPPAGRLAAVLDCCLRFALLWPNGISLPRPVPALRRARVTAFAAPPSPPLRRGAAPCPLRSRSRGTRRLPSLATLVQQGDTVAHLRHPSARLSLRCTCNRDSRTVVVWYLIYPYITTPRTRQEEGRLQRSCIGLLPTGRGALGW